jgi:NADH-quinone oxidoreductase subunit M
MHNRTGPAVTSFEMSLRDGLVLVPLVLVILAFALKPQVALDDSEASVKRAVAPVLQAGGARAQQAATEVRP